MEMDTRPKLYLPKTNNHKAETRICFKFQFASRWTSLFEWRTGVGVGVCASQVKEACGQQWMGADVRAAARISSRALAPSHCTLAEPNVEALMRDGCSVPGSLVQPGQRESSSQRWEIIIIIIIEKNTVVKKAPDWM